MKLAAIYPILYQSKQYQVGDSLPANDQTMVQAWLDAGTAEWQEEAQSTPAKAVPASAEAGLAGDSKNSESAENLVGKVPKVPNRTKATKKNG